MFKTHKKHSFSWERNNQGFSIIEVLICVALVAMLVSVAIPNFTKAQTASDISQSKSDLQRLKLGLESYKIDIGAYPWQNSVTSARQVLFSGGNAPTLERLSSPIDYVGPNTNYVNPFTVTGWYTGNELEEITTNSTSQIFRDYRYNARNLLDTSTWGQNTAHDVDPYWYFLEVSGPDQLFHFNYQMLNAMTSDTETNRAALMKLIYDPTNGAISRGSIWVSGGNPQGTGIAMDWVINQQDTSRVNCWQNY